MARIEDTAKLLAVRERLKRHAVPVVEESDQIYVGSCFLFTRDARRFLVTAHHVAEAINDGNVAIAIAEKRSELWTPGRGQLAFTVEHDVAVMELKDGEFLGRLLGAGYREFLKDADVHRGPLPHDFTLYGYPGENVRVDGDDLVAEPLMIHTTTLQGDPGELKRPRTASDLFLAWQGEERSLQGISGTPVWAVTDPQDGVWTPERAMKIVAVEVSVKKGEWIRSTRWEIVDHVLRRM